MILNIDYSISVINNFPLHFPVSRDSQMREIATMRARVVELESEADRLRRQLTNEKFERSVKTMVYYCSSSCFPIVGVKLDTLLYGYFFSQWSLLLVFSLHFSSSSAFLWSVFTRSSHLSRGLLIFCNLLASLSRLCLVISHLSFWPCVRPISSGSCLFYQLCKPRFQFLLLYH